MKLHAVPQVLNTNVPKVGEFKIKASGKAFKILSSGLYSDKVAAIIRELSCNAYDSHVAAKCPDKPFLVHIPNKIEPWFAVQDFGVGLSDDEINNLYTTFFESTKTDSDDYIGALGLGSKSPFSYTDSFTVATIKDGWKGIYTAFMNEEGCPSIFQLHSEKTKEANGVTVQVPVAQGDIYSFESRAKDILRVFKVKPKLVGVSDDFIKNAFPERKFILNEEDNYFIEDKSFGSLHTAIMGNVAYPIDKSIVNIHSSLYDLSITIIFKIGELDVNAGRESLSYDKQTIAAIEARYKVIAAGIGKKIATELEANKTFFDLSIHTQKMRLTKMSGLIPHTVMFKGKALGTDYIDRFAYRADQVDGYNVLYITQGHRKSPTVEKMWEHERQWRNADKKYLPVQDCIYYVDDLGGSKGLLRVKQFLKKLYNRTHSKATCVMISLDKECYKGAKRSDIVEALSFIPSQVDGLDYYFTSDLDSIARAPKAKKEMPWLYRLDTVGWHNGDRKNTIARKRMPVDTTTMNIKQSEFVYLLCDGLSLHESSAFQQDKYSGLIDVHNALKMLNLTNVYLVNKVGYNTIKNLSNWKTLEVKIAEEFKKHWSDISNYELYKVVIETFNNNSRIGDYERVAEMKHPKIVPILDVVSKYKAKAPGSVIAAMISYYKSNSLKCTKIGVPDMTPDYDKYKSEKALIEQMFKDLYAIHPLLKHISFNYDVRTAEREQLITDYIGA